MPAPHLAPPPRPGSVPNSGQPLPDGWPTAHTSNGVLIVPGLRVRDYNWRETTVTDRRPHIANGLDNPAQIVRNADGTAAMYPDGSLVYSGGVPWFDTANGGSFDGSRLFAL